MRTVQTFILFALALVASGASVRLEWAPLEGVAEFLVWSGPAGGEYTQAQLTTNTTCTVTNLEAGRWYRVALTAYGRENGSETASIAVMLLEEVVWIEEAEALCGPWRVIGSNVVWRTAATGQRFYRSRMERP